ncbi:MAG: polysaccharide lyase [Cyanobacteria bacterium P01_A01_bin.83]
MASDKISNSNISTNSYISQEWKGGHKLEVDITSEFNVDDWMLSFNLSDSSIRDAYGVDLIDNGNGNYSIKGQGNWQNLEPGETAKAIFIVDTNSQKTVMPEFTTTNTLDTNNMNNTQTTQSKINTSSNIADDWNGGYKLEVDLTPESDANNWTLDFELPYSIRDAYGVDLVDNGSGNYTISGQDGWQDLEPGETAKAIFIVNDQGQEAIVPKFNDNLMGSVVSDPIPANTFTPDPEPAPQISQPSQLSSSAISVGFESHSNGTKYDYSTQSKDWDVKWSYQVDKFGTISNEEARSGSNSLKMDYPANEQSNAGSQWQIPNQQEYYLSYWVKFDNDFDFDGPRFSGGKLPGLGAGDLASGGNKPDGNNGFTSRYMWREDGKAVLYLYHMDQPSTYGEDMLLQGNDGSQKYFERGQWHNMVQRVKVNDGSQANGEIDVWMDNEQVLSVDNLRFMTNNQGIDTAFFSTFHGGYGGDWWPEKNDNAYFDDFVVSTNAADVGL